MLKWYMKTFHKKEYEYYQQNGKYNPQYIGGLIWFIISFTIFFIVSYHLTNWLLSLLS